MMLHCNCLSITHRFILRREKDHGDVATSTALGGWNWFTAVRRGGVDQAAMVFIDKGNDQATPPGLPQFGAHLYPHLFAQV